ncbi:hypothetical protein SteCoe_35440 [Stentor coeruleus]|uniref:PDEase domain-containing protein n=1 Tax=Stentor coeruleus TaxID=5963 RepID=A0A1R2ASC3_9CILI|nr:hypothetical protein SteCoe_35440 [Stentor coeruleus]
MWIHLFSVNTGTVRVPNLKNHMIQNNDIAKCVLTEIYLPPHQRINLFFRIFRFIISVPVMMMMGVAVLNNMYGSTPSTYCLYRSECISDCEEVHFLDSSCEDYNKEIKYNGNTYKDLYYFDYKEGNDDFQTCLDYVDLNSDFPWTSDNSRQWRVHTCFKRFKNGTDSNFDYDPRETFTNETGTNVNDLICIRPSETCEKPAWSDEDCSSGVCISFGVIFASIFLANLGQLIFEAALLYTSSITFKPTDLERKVNPVKTEINFSMEEEPPWDKIIKKCIGEITVAIVFLVSCLCAIASLIGVYDYGRPDTVWAEWIIAIVIDQAKSLLVQPLIWWLISRRCGLVTGTFSSWKDEQVIAGINDDSFMTEIRSQFAHVLESRIFTYGVIGLVVFYACFILLNLSIDIYIQSIPVAVDIFYYIDLCLLIIFVIEIVLRFIAWGFTYIFELWNLLDAAIVLTSFAFSVNHTQVKGIAVLRLLRLIRVIIVMRRVSESKKKLLMLKTQNQSVSSNVTRVLDLLEEILKEKTLTRENRNDLSWIIGQIQSRKLYTKSTTDEDETILTEIDKAWKGKIKLDYEDFSESMPILGQKIGGDKVLKRSRQSSIEMKMFNTDHHVERINTTFTSPSMDREPLEKEKLEQIYETLEKIDDWNWDVLKFSQIADTWCFPILCLRLFLKYDIYRKFEEMNLDKWLNYLSSLYLGYQFNNMYHNHNHIIDTVQATHYFYKTAGFENFLSEQDIMVGILAAFIHDYEHPGLTSQFLIRTKHPKAIRYSDISPLENHHVAAAFKLMDSDGERDLLDFLDQKSYKLVRKMLIYMVIRTDLSYHFDLLSSIQGKIYGENFPQDTLEDRLTVMTFTLHCADLSKPARSWIFYRGWIDAMMEEFNMQGKMEKELNIPISPFMDEENTNRERVQLAYIDFIVRDSIDILNILSPNPDYNNIIQRDLGENLNLNRKTLQKKIEGEVKF